MLHMYPSFWKGWPPWIHSFFCCTADVFYCGNQILNCLQCLLFNIDLLLKMTKISHFFFVVKEIGHFRQASKRILARGSRFAALETTQPLVSSKQNQIAVYSNCSPKSNRFCSKRHVHLCYLQQPQTQIWFRLLPVICTTFYSQYFLHHSFLTLLSM